MKKTNLFAFVLIMLVVACQKSEDANDTDEVLTCEGNYLFDLFVDTSIVEFDAQTTALAEYEGEYNRKYIGNWFDETDSSFVSTSRLAINTDCLTQLSDLDSVLDSMCTKAYDKYPDAKLIYLDLSMWRDSTFHGTLKLLVP